jgi:hypothetical protein
MLSSVIQRRGVRCKSTDVSEEHIFSIFMIEEQVEQEASLKPFGKQISA